jgi:aromatic ring hydroxylase
MPIRTGRAFLESLHDDREVWIDGERVRDVTADRRFRGGAHMMAALYEMQHDPELTRVMTYESPSSGQPVGLSFIQPASVDDLVRRREMVKVWADATCGMFGRSPDYMNIMTAGFASAHRAFGTKDRQFGENVLNYYVHARENDVTMTHTLITPQVDRSRPVEKQDKDLAARNASQMIISPDSVPPRSIPVWCGSAASDSGSLSSRSMHSLSQSGLTKPKCSP